MSYRKKHVKSKIHQIRPKKRFYKKPFFWPLFFSAVLIITGLYFYLFFPGFQIKNIEILGNEKLQPDDIKNFASTGLNRKIISIGGWGMFSKSIFFVDLGELNRKILEKFPIIEKVDINKKYPQTIILGITERKPVGIYCTGQSAGTGQQCFLIDETGSVFENILPDVLNSNYTVLRQVSEEKNIYTGENVIQQEIINSILKIKKDLKDNFQIDVKEALISSPSRLDIMTSENWKIYFDLNSEANLQIAKLNLLLKNEISQNSRANIQYIDLRFKNKAYYK